MLTDTAERHRTRLADDATAGFQLRQERIACRKPFRYLEPPCLQHRDERPEQTPFRNKPYSVRFAEQFLLPARDNDADRREIRRQMIEHRTADAACIDDERARFRQQCRRRAINARDMGANLGIGEAERDAFSMTQQQIAPGALDRGERRMIPAFAYVSAESPHQTITGQRERSLSLRVHSSLTDCGTGLCARNATPPAQRQT